VKYIKIVFLVLSLFVTQFSFAAEAPKDEWYPFYFPEKLDPDSPANIGKLVLDPPAGKHGFCKVKDGHFYFEDGTRAKFWGTNLCMSACFPDKKQAEALAERIAFFGFNAVRLTHMDFYFEPKGIFEDALSNAKDPQIKKTTKFSEKQLDRLDYLIYQLKQRGIYTDMTLLFRRHFTKADGVIDADKLDGGAKPVSMFDPKLIHLQKEYAKALLTHYNSYTKLRYCDDPAIALVEITNENSIRKYKMGKLPEYYRKEFYKLTKSFPKDKRIDLIEKRYFDEMTDFLRNKVQVKVPISGSQYSSAKSQESCDFIDKHAYWDHPRFSHKNWDRDDFKIHNKSMLLDKDLGIINPLIVASREAMKQSKPFTVTEWNHCYPNQYAYEAPVLVACEALKYDWNGLFQFDYKAFEHENDIFDYFETIANPQKLILTSLGGLIFLKGEHIEREIKDGIFTINTPSLSAAVGFIKNIPITLRPFIITADQNGAVILLKQGEKYILFAISEVKNTESGWNPDRKFTWGKPPVLLKRINVAVQRNNKTIRVDLSKSPFTEINY